MQWRQRNVQKSVMHLQNGCFANQTYCFFEVLVAVAIVVSEGPYCWTIQAAGNKTCVSDYVTRQWFNATGATCVAGGFLWFAKYRKRCSRAKAKPRSNLKTLGQGVRGEGADFPSLSPSLALSPMVFFVWAPRVRINTNQKPKSHKNCQLLKVTQASLRLFLRQHEPNNEYFP